MSKAERTRQTIIEQVAETFNKKGYYATSLNDLLQATGLSKGSIYGNFIDKEEVAVEAFKYNINNLINKFEHGIRSCDNSIDKLLAYVKVYEKENYNLILRGGCPLLNTLTESDDMGGKLKDLSVQIVNRWNLRIIKIIKKGVVNNEIKRNTNAETVANLMISLFEGAGILTKSTGNNHYMDNALKHITKVIMGIKN